MTGQKLKEGGNIRLCRYNSELQTENKREVKIVSYESQQSGLLKKIFYNYGAVPIICTLKAGTYDDRKVKLRLCFNKHQALKTLTKHKNISTHYQLDII